MRNGRYEESEEAVYEAMDIAHENFEPESLKLAGVLETYAEWLVFASQFDEAHGVALEVQGIYRAKLPPEAPDHGRVGAILEATQGR